jgi:hypothetical protein
MGQAAVPYRCGADETFWITHFTPDPDLGDAPVDYKATTTPGDIWKARGFAWNKHVCYMRMARKAEDVQDVFAIPVFGAAISAVAIGLTGGGAAAVGGAGLGGGSAAGLYSYSHPDVDAKTDHQAAAALLCLVDGSENLRHNSSIPLILDEAALRDARRLLDMDIQAIQTDSGIAGGKTADAALTAARAADEGVDTTIMSLESEIKSYAKLPGLLYSLSDQIDQDAQAKNPRTIDYASIKSSLQQSVVAQATKNDSKTASAQSKSITAALQASVGSKTENQRNGMSEGLKKATIGTHQPGGEVSPVPDPKRAPDLAAITTSQSGEGAKRADATVEGPQDASSDGSSKAKTAAAHNGIGSGGTAEKQVAELATVLNDSAVPDLEKVNRLLDRANRDLDQTDFANVSTALQGCKLDPSSSTAATQGAEPMVNSETPASGGNKPGSSTSAPTAGN